MTINLRPAEPCYVLCQARYPSPRNRLKNSRFCGHSLQFILSISTSVISNSTQEARTENCKLTYIFFISLSPSLCMCKINTHTQMCHVCVCVCVCAHVHTCTYTYVYMGIKRVKENKFVLRMM